MIDINSIPFENSVASRLLKIAEQHENRPAIKIDNHYYCYNDLFAIAKKIAAELRRSSENRCLILANKNIVAYAGILAALLAGKAYVFLNTKDNLTRLKKSVLLADSHLMITDQVNQLTVPSLQRLLDYELHCICLNEQGDIVNQQGITEYKEPPSVYPYAYMMFTSGSTGEPKGAIIAHTNLQAYLDNIIARIKPMEEDRFSQINELTFDVSVHDIFVCWSVGACLFVLPENYIFGIPKYVRDNKITYWISVPSIVNLLEQLNRLNADSFNSIKYSIFCGEPLTQEVVKKWQKIAPHTIIDNLYGPTETTIAITAAIWDEEQHYDDIVIPIGHPFMGQGIYLLNNNHEIVADGEIGEIALYGTQVSASYWKNDDITRERYIIVNNRKVYKTGDLALFHPIKGLIYKGRIDDQFKIRGYRVEKLAIENTIKQIARTQLVAIVAFKEKSNNYVQSLICFICETKLTREQLISRCRQELPDYMCPNYFIELNELPYNKNGKIDYPALTVLAAENDNVKDIAREYL